MPGLQDGRFAEQGWWADRNDQHDQRFLKLGSNESREAFYEKMGKPVPTPTSLLWLSMSMTTGRRSSEHAQGEGKR